MITSLLTVGLGRMPGVSASPISPRVALTLAQCRWVLSHHLQCQMWAMRGTQQCCAEPGAVGISLPAAPQHGGCWGVNTPLNLGLQPRLPPRGLSGLRMKEEMAAFMAILLRHPRPSSFFFFFSWKHGVLGHCCFCFFLLLPGEPGLMTQKLLKTSCSALPQSGLKIMRFLPNRDQFFSLVLWRFWLGGNSSVVSSEACVILFYF